jgi:hypothetical protein
MTINVSEHDCRSNNPNSNTNSRSNANRRRRRNRKPRKPRITAPPNAPVIELQQCCVRCHRTAFAIGPGKAMHAASLLCASCHRFHGWASRNLARALGVAS